MCHIDLGLYYLKLIRWTETLPLVPGLVNVQEQLVFNQNAFLITALFDGRQFQRLARLYFGVLDAAYLSRFR